ncbi:MAG: DUF4386 domain-containing protein [Candidatus Hodarchaeales archaeon]|jgi:hypothetical protein
MSIESFAMRVSGFLYLFILGTNAASVGLGNRMDEKEEDAVDKLLTINKNPNRFKQSIVIALISHSSIIAITGMFYLAFNQYNQTLTLIGSIFRLGEALILSSIEIGSLSLLNLAKEYTVADDAEKITLSISCGNHIQKKNFRFIIALSLLSIGHLSFVILFLSSGVVFMLIVLLGLAASVLSVIGTGIVLVKPNVDILYKIGLTLIMLYEIILGVWLLFF